jgi:hypothetical protein
MSSLPMACSLDEVALRNQLERYRLVGREATVVDRGRRRLTIALGEGVAPGVVDELVAIESECCPFFGLDWRPAERRLTVSVADSGHEPALEAIASALGLGEMPAR